MTEQLIQHVLGVNNPVVLNKQGQQERGGNSLLDFSPTGVARSRQVILDSLNASPTFAWQIRTFGSSPIMTIDPLEVIAARDAENKTGVLTLSQETRSEDVLGWSIGPFAVVVNTSAKTIQKRKPIGQRRGTTRGYTNADGAKVEFLGNADLSAEGTLWHEWGHSFWARLTGWHNMFKGISQRPDAPGTRKSRVDYMFPGVKDSEQLATFIKETFDASGFIPYSSSNFSGVVEMIDKARRDIARRGDDESDFISLLNNYDAQVSIGKWKPELSDSLTETISARYPYLVETLAPLIRVKYGTSSRQEQFSELNILFVTSDKAQRSKYLSPELESIMAYVFGLKSDPSEGDYPRPWDERSGLASRSTARQQSIDTVSERVHSGRELFVRNSSPRRRLDAVSYSDGMMNVSVGNYRFSSPDGIPSWEKAYESWNDWQDNWRMRYVSSEIMGLDSLSPQSDARPWQSLTNNHLLKGDVSTASPEVKKDIQKSAMMTISLMNEISNGGYASDSPIYRSVNNVADDSVLGSAQVGTSLSMPLTSFTPDYAGVVDFSKNSDQTTLSDALASDNKNVIIKLMPGVSVVNAPVTKPTADKDGRIVNMPIESITAGQFVVRSIKNENGFDVIELEQTEVVDPILGSRSNNGKQKAIDNKRNAELTEKMTESLNSLSEKKETLRDADGVDAKNKASDDVSFEARRYETIMRSLRSHNDTVDKLDTPTTIGGLASSSRMEDRAERHGVSLDAFNDEAYDADDVEWSSNDWSFGKTNKVMAGDVVVVRTRDDGKKEILTIERKSGPFRGALSLPGGLQDEGEDLYETAEREMLEEVNVSPSDATGRRILGQVETKDWDPRFVEGGRIAGIRFDITDQQSSVVKAGDDANKFNWVDVEEMSTGKYPIAFGHASWLAESFADDPVLGPRFAVLAEASRIRNQRLMKKIDEKRREAGVKEFGDMPDPSLPYPTTTEGVNTGFASASSSDRNISPPTQALGPMIKMLGDNIDYLNTNSFKDNQSGQDLNGAWAEEMVQKLKRGKITHSEAMDLYLALTRIADKDSRSNDSVGDAFERRTLLNSARRMITGNDQYKVERYTRDGKPSWAVYRGSDYLGDYDSEIEATRVARNSVEERSTSGLASSNESSINWDSLYGEGPSGYIPDIREELEGYLTPGAIDSIEKWTNDIRWPKAYLEEVTSEDYSDHYDVLQSRLIEAGFPEVVTITRRGTPDSRGNIRNGSAFEGWRGGNDDNKYSYGLDKTVFVSQVPRENIIGVGSLEEGEFFYRNDGVITLSEDGRMPETPSRTVRGKSEEWVDLATKSFTSDAPSFSAKSLNYTKPELRNRIKNRIMAGSKGGNPGQWSARKAQLLAIAYREAGGGYRGGLRKTQRSLKKWTREKWTTSDGKPAIRKGGTRRYLPSTAWSRLTPAQRAATNRKKISGSRQGNQFVANTRSAANASRRARD